MAAAAAARDKALRAGGGPNELSGKSTVRPARPCADTEKNAAV